MPTLIQSLQNRDLGHLRIVAALWGVELLSNDANKALEELAAALLDLELVREIVDTLSADARSTLETLAEADGKISWAAFARRFGEIREAGPGQRDREQIHLHPISTAEILFFRALLARAFFDTPSGAQEFAYIPDDLLKSIPVGAKHASPSLGRLATPKERTHPIPASDYLLDDVTTLLAALRMGLQPPEMRIPVRTLTEFLSAAEIIVGGKPQGEPARLFLEASRKDALERLTSAWQESETFNELLQVSGLVCEGEWTNQPLVTREFLLNLLDALPKNQWWSLPAFVRAVKEKFPDFQRPAGDYDSWFIKRTSDGTYLRGFACWDEVDGALIRYFISGPMTWLGMVELASAEAGGMASAFRLKSNAKNNLTSDEREKIIVTSNGKIDVPRMTPRAARYQIARFCEWEEEKPDEYRYRVTTGSLKKAAEQGLKVGQLLGLLAKNSAAQLPPAFVKSLKRWEVNGTEARVEVQTVLRVSRPEVLAELRKSKAGRFLGESLGPVTVIVKPGAQSKVLAALAELGLLADYITGQE